jgi:antitoxin component HigA of HigAB toxin-antitoxin module
MPVEESPRPKNSRPSRAAGGKRTKRAGKPIPGAYLQLMHRFLLRPIQSDDELEEAAEVADDLAARDENLRQEERDYFDVLCHLIEKYEDEVVRLPDVGGAAMLRFLIEQRGVTQQTVAAEAGIANSTLSAVLKGTRRLNLEHIEKLAPYFGVEPAVFLPGNE